MDARHADRGVHAALRRPGRGVRAQRRGQRRAAHDRRELPGRPRRDPARDDLGRQERQRPPRAGRGRRAAPRRLLRRQPQRAPRRGRIRVPSHAHLRRRHVLTPDPHALPGGRRCVAADRARAGRGRGVQRAARLRGDRPAFALTQHHRGRSRRRAAGRDLPPRLRRLADRLPGEAALVHAARRSGPDEHAAGRRRPRVEDVGGRQRLLAELLRRRARQVGRRPGHLRRHVAALQGHHVAGASPRLRLGLAQLAGGGGRGSGLADRARPLRRRDDVHREDRQARAARRALDGRARDAPLHQRRCAGGQGPARGYRRHALLGLAEADLPAGRGHRDPDLLGHGHLPRVRGAEGGVAHDAGPLLADAGLRLRQVAERRGNERRAPARHRRRRGLPAPDRRRPDALHPRRGRARPRARPLRRQRRRLST